MCFISLVSSRPDYGGLTDGFRGCEVVSSYIFGACGFNCLTFY